MTRCASMRQAQNVQYSASLCRTQPDEACLQHTARWAKLLRIKQKVHCLVQGEQLGLDGQTGAANPLSPPSTGALSLSTL